MSCRIHNICECYFFLIFWGHHNCDKLLSGFFILSIFCDGGIFNLYIISLFKYRCFYIIRVFVFNMICWTCCIS
jgi:hypothetical protein